MSSGNKERVTLFAGVSPAPILDATLAEVAELIQRDDELARETKALRAVLTREGKPAFDTAKRKLLAATFAGTFTRRSKSALVSYTGLAPLDIDKGVSDPARIRDAVHALPWIALTYLSPSGRGVKAVARLANTDPSHHAGGVAHACALVRHYVGNHVDEAQHDYTRLSFLAGDREARFRDAGEALPIPASPPLPPQAPRARFAGPFAITTGRDTPLEDWRARLRRDAANRCFRDIDWQDDGVTGFLDCPGAKQHTSENRPEDCRIVLTGVPSIHCFHTSCADAVALANHELRSRIGVAEKVRSLVMRYRTTGGGQ